MERREKIVGVDAAKGKNIVTSALDFNALAQELLVLESMLTSNSMAPEWQAHKAAWIMRVKQCAGPAVLEQLVGVLENTIQWHRILVAPDGRPLSAEELASGQFGVGGFPPTPLPPPLSLTLAACAMSWIVPYAAPGHRAPRPLVSL